MSRASRASEEEGGSEGQMNRGEEVIQSAFKFSPKHERKPSDEEQVETKRPKSPGRQDEKQEEQHVDSVYDTNLKLMKKVLENQDKARDKWFAAKETAGPSEQHKGDGSKRE